MAVLAGMTGLNQFFQGFFLQGFFLFTRPILGTLVSVMENVEHWTIGREVEMHPGFHRDNYILNICLKPMIQGCPQEGFVSRFSGSFSSLS